MSEVAKLEVDGKVLELPVVRGTEGEVGVDITRLRSRGGVITLDPGYANTGSCLSSVTFIDGEHGVLRYRGYAIEELAEKSSFLEAAYLLIEGELPTREQRHDFTEAIRYHTMIHEDLKRFYGAFPKSAHPMAVCSGAVSALSSFYPDSLDPRDPEQVRHTIHRLIAKLPTLVAYAHKHCLGQPFPYPDNQLDYAGNFLHLMFATPCEPYEVDPVVRDALDLLLLLHADHEQNCSTSTVRMVGSSMVNLFGVIAAGIQALWGSRHGGANQSVIEMLTAIRDEGLSARQFVERAKSGDERARLFGFGHRVYKSFDPRARILKRACYDVLDRLGVHSPLLEIAVELEHIATEDAYFQERNLYPNIDFYSGIIYDAIGVPTKVFPALFAMGRLPGWIAQWLEMQGSKERISRPRQIYVGPNERAYVAIDDRGAPGRSEPPRAAAQPEL